MDVQFANIMMESFITTDGIELIEGNHNGDYDMLEFIGSNKYWSTLKKYL